MFLFCLFTPNKCQVWLQSNEGWQRSCLAGLRPWLSRLLVVECSCNTYFKRSERLHKKVYTSLCEAATSGRCGWKSLGAGLTRVCSRHLVLPPRSSSPAPCTARGGLLRMLDEDWDVCAPPGPRSLFP